MASEKIQPKGMLIWGICAAFFLYEFLLRTVIGTFQQPIMHDLHLSSFQFSFLSTTIFFLVYGLMQIPVGLIVDHIGLKKSLIVGTLICAFSAIGFGYSESYFAALFYRLMMGLGASFGFVCLLVAVFQWTPKKHSGIWIGFSQFVGTLGPMLAAGPLESLSHSSHVDWRLVFFCLGAFGFALLVLIVLFVENNHSTTGHYTILRRPETVRNSIARLFLRSQPWLIALLCGCLYFSTEYLSENEGRTFLALKGMSLYTASYMITLSWIGYAIGCPFLGFLSDRIKRRKIVLSIAAICGVIAMTTIVYASSPYLLMGGFFLMGVSSSGQGVGFAMMIEQFKKEYVAVGFGLNNGMITFLSAINAPIIGWLLDASKQGSGLSIATYQNVFTLMISLSLAACILSFFFIKETYCKSSVDFTYLKAKTA